MNQTQIVFYFRKVIDIIEKPKVTTKLKASRRENLVKIILCDIVFFETYHICRYAAKYVISKISHIFKQDIKLSKIKAENIAIVITKQFQICHSRDNKFPSQCQAKNYMWVTLNNICLKTSKLVRVAAFYLFMKRGI